MIFVFELAQSANYQFPLKLPFLIGLKDGAFLQINLARVEIQVLGIFLETVLSEWKFTLERMRRICARTPDTWQRNARLAERRDYGDLNQLHVVERGTFLALSKQRRLYLVPRHDGLGRNLSVIGRFRYLVGGKQEAASPRLVQTF